MKIAKLLSAGCVAGLAMLAQVAPAQEGGSVKGTFVLKGDVPTLAPKVAAGANVKDGAVCAAGAVPNEDLVVDPATKGVANVFIWIYKVDEKDVPAALKEPKEPKVVIDQKGCVFTPHAFVARVGQELVMLNGDAVAHNVHTFPLRGAAINDLIAPNDREGVSRKLEKPEILPIPVKCDIHPWMQGYMLVVDHPFAAVSDAKGAFTIEGLPAGEHEFRVWQEAGGWIDRSLKVKVEAGKATDLGKIEIDAAKLEVGK